jgi:hypothetical protein
MVTVLAEAFSGHIHEALLTVELRKSIVWAHAPYFSLAV